jgi:hypothetical protein
MSDTVVNHILKGLRDKVNAEFANNPNIKSGKISDLPELSVFGSQIRLGADKDQEGIMTQRSLDLLAKEFLEGSEGDVKEKEVFGRKTKAAEYAKGPNSKGYPLVEAYLIAGGKIKDLARDSATLLGNSNTFDQFVAWYKIKYLGELTKANIEFSDKTVGTRYEGGLIIDSAASGKNDLKALIAKGVAHREFNARFAQFIATKNPLLSEFIDANTDAGHFLGIFNSKFATILDLEVDQVQGGKVYDLTVKSKLDNAGLGQGMDTYIESMSQSLILMAQADAISSNLLSNISLASTTSKRVHTKSKPGAYVASTEVQISRANQAAGRKLSAAARQLKKLAQTAKDASFDNAKNQFRTTDFRKELVKLFTSISTLGSYIDSLADKINAAGSKRTDEEKALALALKAQAGTIANVLKDTSGSDSFNTAISKSLKAAFKGQPKPAEQYTVSKDSLPLGKPSNKNLKVPNVKKSKSSVTSTSERPVKVKIPKVNMSLALPTNLTGLEELINSQLVERIKQNMGSGNRRDILNLRTGRFAESVKVERLSESRAGMITAFYTYMRNPYATFSEGGKQQSPRSRDPKLLISKSIREIAQAKVQNRLRAVLV